MSITLDQLQELVGLVKALDSALEENKVLKEQVSCLQDAVANLQEQIERHL